MSDKKKKIGFLSAIVLVISSCIGAGIFFKSGTVLNNVHQNLYLAISAWIIAALGVIAMALALVEISGACPTKSDKGFVGWNKVFSPKWIYFSCKNFMTFIFFPTTFFFMPLYGIKSIIDALGSFGLNVSNSVPWWFIVIIAFVIDTWFIFVSGYSSRAANIQSWLITSVKFIPLIVAVIIGFVIFGLNNGSFPDGSNINNINPDKNPTTHPEWTLFGISPAFGLFSSLSAVFFAYDGFYVACGINSQMKEPKKVPLALVIGLSLVTVIYLLIAVSCMLGSPDGTWVGFINAFNESQGWKITYGILSIIIAFGVFGIVNCDAVWAPRFIEDLIRTDDLFNWGKKYKHKLNPDRPVVGVWINYSIFVPICILFACIGALGYIPGDIPNYPPAVQQLYAFCDLSSSWNAVIVFAFICLSILGGLINRMGKKKGSRVEIKEKTKYFIPCAIVAMIIISACILIELFAPLYNLGSMINELNKGADIPNHTQIGTIMLVIVLFIYITLMFIPVPWDYKTNRNEAEDYKYLPTAKPIDYSKAIKKLFKGKLNKAEMKIVYLIYTHKKITLDELKTLANITQDDLYHTQILDIIKQEHGKYCVTKEWEVLINQKYRSL